MERKLASIRRILALNPIPDADKIELCLIDGWQSVVKKNEFHVGDLVVFTEIDSILPSMPWSEFLKDKNKPNKPIRVKTCKLKKVLSQGIVFPLSILPPNSLILEEGLDVTELLGITKYEPYIPAQLVGKIKGNFPTYLFPKTDSERLQNVWNKDFKSEIQGVRFVARIKEDGCSISAFYYNGEVGVCSRNLQLQLDDTNVYVEMFQKYKLEDLFKSLNLNIAIQAEVCGVGIQKNHGGYSDKQIKVFDIYDIDAHRYYDYPELIAFCAAHDLPQVYTIDNNFVFDKNKHDLNYFIKMTEVKYELSQTQIEGLVFTSITEKYSDQLRGRLRFKVINPDYLLANE